MADNTISFADATRTLRRHYPITGASEAHIVDAVHQIDLLTKFYLSAISATVLPLNENLPITSGIPDFEHFAKVLHGLVALKLARPLLRAASQVDDPDQSA